jgi:hypothetical protein
MQNALTIPGAAVMYHTLEFNQPLDLSAKGQKRQSKIRAAITSRRSIPISRSNIRRRQVATRRNTPT